MIDCQRNRNASRAMAAGERRAPPGDSRRRLVQVAAAAAATPARRSNGSRPMSTIQSARNQAARETTGGKAPRVTAAPGLAALAREPCSLGEFMALTGLRAHA